MCFTISHYCTCRRVAERPRSVDETRYFSGENNRYNDCAKQDVIAQMKPALEIVSQTAIT